MDIVEEAFKKIKLDEYYQEFALKKKRFDDRQFEQFRSFTLSNQLIETADSSVCIKLGHTNVICFTQLEKKDGDEDVPLITLSVSMFQQNKPNQRFENLMNDYIEHIKLSQESKKNLEDEEIKINLDLRVINNDGNIYDASVISIIAALNSIKMNGKNISLECCPISTSFAIIEDLIVLDPTSEEEKLASGTAAILMDDKTGKFLFLEKHGGTGFDEKRWNHLFNTSKVWIKKISNRIQQSL